MAIGRGIRLREHWGKKALWDPYVLSRSVLKAWWSADDLAASSVSTWTDRIGGMATTAATTAIPTWNATSWTANSKPGVTFDGVANCMASTSLTTLPTAAVAGEVWLLATQATLGTTAGGTIPVQYGGTGGSRRLSRQPVSNVNRVRESDGTATLTDTVTNYSGAHIIGGFWSGTTMGLRIDGADASPATMTITSLNTGTTRLRIGASNATTADSFFSGVVRHVIIPTLLTSTQRLQLEGYLAWDGWSSAASNPLPSTHPYKFSPP